MPSTSLSQNSRRAPLGLEAWLFLACLGLEAAVFIWMCLASRITAGHDTWQYFLFRYYFLNGAATSGEIPHWFPHLAQGTVATWFYQYSGGLAQNLLLYLAPLLKNFNYLPIFYFGVFADEFMLLIGTWLWARRYLRQPLAVFFVTLSVMASCVWINQPWFNLRLYSAFPLIIYFVHRFLDSGRWREAFFAGNLAAFQTIGSMPYFLPFLSWLGFVYFAFWGLCNFSELKTALRRIKLGWPALACLAGVGISLGAAFAATRLGTSDMLLMHRSGPDFTVDLKEFLTYADNFRPVNWLELVLRASPVMDWSVYLGLLCLPLCLIGLKQSLSRPNLGLSLCLAMLLAFANATIISRLSYHLWPMMRYYRHISYVSLMAKLFLALLAGFGVQSLCEFKPEDKTQKKLILAGACLSALIAASLFALALNDGLFRLLDDKVLRPMVANIGYTNQITAIFLEPTRIKAGFQLGGLIGAAGALILLGFAWPAAKRWAGYLPALLLALQIFDVYNYKYTEFFYRSIALTPDEAKAMTFNPLTFTARRETKEPEPGPLSELPRRMPLVWGVRMWFTDAFTRTDRVLTDYKTQYWHAPLNDFMLSFPQGQLAAAYEKLFQAFPIPFPLANPVAAKLGGVSRDKVQIFDEAYFKDTLADLKKALGSPEYAGDVPLLYSRNPYLENPNPLVHPRWKLARTAQDLGRDARQEAKYEVVRFDSNNLVLKVQSDPEYGGWLQYSDVWHPWWRAELNGDSVPIYKSSLAYKAVKLKPGENEVLLRVHSPWLQAIYFFFAMNSLLWITFILKLSWNILTRKALMGSESCFR